VPIKSVHITNYYHKNSGGISTSFNNLMAAAMRHRRFVRLIVPGETETVEDVNEFAKIYYVPARQSPVFDKRYRVMMPWDYMPNDSIIRRILLAEMPDIIEVTDKYTLSMLGAMIRVGKFKQKRQTDAGAFFVRADGRQYRVVFNKRRHRQMVLRGV
jgi:hypothetical protein